MPDQLAEITGVTGDPGTKGAKTVVTVELALPKNVAQLDATNVTAIFTDGGTGPFSASHIAANPTAFLNKYPSVVTYIALSALLILNFWEFPVASKRGGTDRTYTLRDHSVSARWNCRHGSRVDNECPIHRDFCEWDLRRLALT